MIKDQMVTIDLNEITIWWSPINLHPTYTKKYGFDRIDRAAMGASKHHPHIQGKCDSTHVWLDGHDQLLNNQ